METTTDCADQCFVTAGCVSFSVQGPNSDMCVLSDASVSDEVVQNDVDSPDAFYDIGCFVCNSAAPRG